MNDPRSGTTLPVITKFPWPFADREPQFKPRSIDPVSHSLRTYEAWEPERRSIWPRWLPWAFIGMLTILGAISWWNV